MQQTLYLDLETYSPIPIKNGVYKYSEKAEILLFAYAFNNDKVKVLDCTNHVDQIRYVLMMAIEKSARVCAHNSNFDRVILKKFFPEIVNKLEWVDTLVRAYAHGLPGGLSKLCEIFNLEDNVAKNKEGRKLILLFCKPQAKNSKIKRATKDTHPAEWKKFIEYAASDIESMRVLDDKIPEWNDSKFERELWYLDQKINDRGFKLDLDLANAAIEALNTERAIKNKATAKATGGEVQAATQRDALLKYILEVYGITLPNMQAATLNRRLQDPELDEGVKELIRLRLESTKTSTAKFKSAINAVCEDGRLRGGLQFCAAQRTARWGGRIFQPHNLPRPAFKNTVINQGIESIKAGCADLVFESVAKIASSVLRGLLIAPNGKKLVVSDLSSIEGRYLAWLAGEEWKLEAYRNLDIGFGEGIYELTYANTFSIPVTEVTPEQRQIGKVLELGLGYQGGVGAFITFSSVYKVDLDSLAETQLNSLPTWAVNESLKYWEYCVNQDIDRTLGLSEEVFITCDAIKRLWRDKNPAIVNLWDMLQSDVWQVIRTKKRIERETYEVDKKGSWLRIRLPSGRYVCYPGARINNKQIEYLGINTYNKKWGWVKTYGGKLAENITQAGSRDVLAHSMQPAENAGYKIILSVHDELLTEAPDRSEFNEKELSKILSQVPFWVKNLPLAAAGFQGARYRKD